jgi:hypothetical protein
MPRTIRHVHRTDGDILSIINNNNIKETGDEEDNKRY